jgi:hypothetical protein
MLIFHESFLWTSRNVTSFLRNVWFQAKRRNLIVKIHHLKIQKDFSLTDQKISKIRRLNTKN